MRIRAVAVAIVTLVVLTTGTPRLHAAIFLAGGEVTGVYEATPSIPPPGAMCTTITAEITATSESASLGTLTASGNASSENTCESALSGGGTVSLVVQFESVSGSSYDCQSMTGRYIRLATKLVVIATDRCVRDQYGTQLLSLTLDITLIPTTSHGWFVGTWAVRPEFEG
jgi:hypothetical protein